MGAFYYRPIDPGYGALGAGIGAGIEGAADAFADERERKRQARADKMRLDLMFIEGGGGPGDLPTEQYQEPVPDRPLAVSPDGITMPHVGRMLTRQKPGFIAVGEGESRGYVRDPVALEGDRAGRERARAVQYRDEDWKWQTGKAAEERARLRGPGVALIQGKATDADIAALIEGGMDIGALDRMLDPGIEPGTQAWYDDYEKRLGIQDAHETPRDPPIDRGLMTPMQAEEWLFDEFGDEIDPVDRMDIAQGMARGEEYKSRLPRERMIRPDAGAMAGYPAATVKRTMNRGPRRAEHGVETRAAPTLDSPPTPEEAAAARDALPNATSPDEWREWIANQRAQRR